MILLAIGVATALNAVTIAVLYEAIFHTDSSGLSDNAVQLLTGWGGGVIGVLGAWVGIQAGRDQPPRPDEPATPDPDAPSLP